MKKSLSVVSMLLICLLALSTTPLIFGNFASASTCVANFLPNYYVNGLDTQNEVNLSENTANYIRSVLNSKYPMYDCRNTGCTDYNFGSILNALQSYDTAVVYTKGHRNAVNCINGNKHIGLIMNNGATVWDCGLWYVTSSKNVHTFNWHCETAIMPPGTHWDGCGCYGLPAAFTHNLNIPLWSNSGSQVYLGWTNTVPSYPYPQQQGGSPQYEWAINSNYNYAQVAAIYYYYMGQNYATSSALNLMANTIYSTSFQNTPLGNWLEVYGNMYLGLP
ncbi:MAG: hypothetical protein LBQ98_06080 [Nitrososphaerota archaeon]|jgi:hypothetical protein|nr:hypothetical protein [Nitrososphaerota archaeon]